MLHWDAALLVLEILNVFWPLTPLRVALCVLKQLCPSIGAAYTGTWEWVTMPGQTTASAGSTTLVTSVDLRSLAMRGDTVRFLGEFFVIHGSDPWTATSLPVASAFQGTSQVNGSSIWGE
jgi:hypothetical protein